jgi:hypothetical protein
MVLFTVCLAGLSPARNLLNTNLMWDVRKALPVTRARKVTTSRTGFSLSLLVCRTTHSKCDRLKPVLLRRLLQGSFQDGQTLLRALA